MKDTITLRELAAIVIRRGRISLVLAVVFALLLGSVQAVRTAYDLNKSKVTPEELEEQYQEALKAYEERKKALEKDLSRTEYQLETQKIYNETSPLMEIDPYNKAITTINLAISDIDEGAFQQVFRLEDTPIDFIISKIQSQYIILWNSLDLENILSGSPRDGMEDKYLREIISLQRIDGGCITLRAFGTTELESRQLADAAYRCLEELQTTISAGSYLHNFTVLSDVTKVVVDEALESTQTSNLNKITTYTDNITSLKESLEELKEPERTSEDGNFFKILSTAIKYAVFGFALGLLLAIVWSLVTYILRNCVETSRQLEQELSLPFLGSIAKQCRFWDRLADRILDERVWPEQSLALAYIAGNFDVRLPESGIVLLTSTLPLVEHELQTIVDILKSENRTVHFVSDTSHNAETAKALQLCDCVVLAERAAHTRWDIIGEFVALAKNLNKPVSGFIMI